MNRTIRYAIKRDDNMLISRVGNQLAWPIMDFEGIGKNGNYQAPIEFNLEKIDMYSAGREWNLLVWTKHIPTPLKNAHREFWGMPALPVEPPAQTLRELCAQHKVTRYWMSGALRGIEHGNWGTSVKLYHWFVATSRGYVLSDVTDNLEDDEHKDAVLVSLKKSAKT